jgi:dTDP-glucose pyrophosphorylase
MAKQSRWEQILVAPELPIADAVAQMDQHGRRSLVVADAARKLLGTVSDGDVRRALLRGIDLKSPVAGIMQKEPRVARGDWSKTRLLSCMERYQLLLLPVVDDDYQVISIAFLYDLLQKPRLDNAVCLMAGGFGTRLRPLTESCPKPMLRLGDKPILELIMLRFIQAGFHRFYISTHYMPELIRDYFGDGSRWGVSIEYLHEGEPLGTAGALGLMPQEELEEPMFVMNGDLLTEIDFLQLLAFHEEQGGDCTICVREFDYQVPYGVVSTCGHQVTAIVEKPIHKYFVNAGIYVLSPAFIRQVEAGTRVDMPTLLTNCMQNGGKVNHFPVEQDWIDIGRLDDFKKAQQLVNAALQEL